MEDGLRTVMKEYIDQVNDVCLRLLAGLCLKSKADFLCSRKLRWGIEYEINGTKYLLHVTGNGIWTGTLAMEADGVE